jgi:predicted RNA-binding Zn-ribbon protein involved in translation (DUF1610 family)
MKCPLSSGYFRWNDEDKGYAIQDCLKDKCEWWDDGTLQCDPTGLIPYLKQLIEAIKALPNPGPTVREVEEVYQTVTLKIKSGHWVERVCPQCGTEISLLSTKLRKVCDIDGSLTIKCPKCGAGKIKYSVTPPLTKQEVTVKALERG